MPAAPPDSIASPCRRLLRAALACCAAPPAALLGGCAPDAARSDWRVLETRETRFGRLAVVERGRRRYLAYGRDFDRRFMYESVLDLDRPHELAAPYARLMMLGFVYADPCTRVAQIGVGAGTMTGYALRTFPRAAVDAVDIDAHAVQLGARYFSNLTPQPRLALHIADGRDWLAAQPPGRFDAVMLDAYDDASIPPALADRAFFALVAERLAPGGVAMQNVYLPKVDAARLLAAMRAAFDHVDAHRADDNLVLAAWRGAQRDAGLLAARAGALDAELRPAHPLAAALRQRTGLP